MNKKILPALAAVVVLGAAYPAYMYWQDNYSKPVIVQAKNTPLPPPAPVASQVVEAVPAQPPLPQLAKSDSFVIDALAGLVGNQALMKFFHAEQLIHNIVVTVDNLPQQRVPVNFMPFNPPSGRFLTAGPDDNLSISLKNANRYTSYVKIAEAIDAKKLVELYVHLYPLFQQAYKDIGYPNGNFNDQLSETLDDLLDTPDLKEPIKLIQPNYFYLYAKPDIEALSIGQKIMLRLGSKNVKIVKNKLLEIQKELVLHTKDLKAE